MEPSAAIRLDKWLFFARFFKTRSLAAKVVTDGGVRVNGVRVSKPSASVRVGDRLTFTQGDAVRVVDVVAPGERRGPAPEAQALYVDHSPPRAPRQPHPARGTGARPTKRDRRQMAERGFTRDLDT